MFAKMTLFVFRYLRNEEEIKQTQQHRHKQRNIFINIISSIITIKYQKQKQDRQTIYTKNEACSIDYDYDSIYYDCWIVTVIE